MALADLLGEADHEPNYVATTATITIGTLEDGGPTITGIHLDAEADVPNVSESDFKEHAEAAKNNCPVSKPLATNITPGARLVS